MSNNKINRFDVAALIFGEDMETEVVIDFSTEEKFIQSVGITKQEYDNYVQLIEDRIAEIKKYRLSLYYKLQELLPYVPLADMDVISEFIHTNTLREKTSNPKKLARHFKAKTTSELDYSELTEEDKSKLLRIGVSSDLELAELGFEYLVSNLGKTKAQKESVKTKMKQKLGNKPK